MAKIFVSETAVPAWLEAAKHLLGRADRTDFNLVLEISKPTLVAPNDKQVMTKVDKALREFSKQDLTLLTVMGTIFPQSMYLRYGRPGMYEAYKKMLDRGHKPGWGTYADRMMNRPGKDGISTINPLEIIVEKLKSNAAQGRRNSYRSSYELGVADPEGDLLPWPHKDVGADLPTYNPAFDSKVLYGLPCLSHVSFKLIDRERVNMTAIYRSHHYCSRALGNLLGLSQLLAFVAKEAGLQAGSLTCISTHAELDVQEWGGIAQARLLL
jgi:hypothetical protein